MTTAIEPVQAAPAARRPNTLAGLLESRKQAMAMVLPKHLTPDRLIKIALVAVSKTPKLMECTHESILQSVMTAAQLGLDCGGALGSAYLVPFKKNQKDDSGNWDSWMECQLIIGYRGMIDLARRSGQISSIEARVVWERDEFEVEYGMNTRLKHKPCLEGDPGKLRLVYAVCHLRDEGVQFEMMTRAQIDAVRGRSKSKDNGPWVTDYPEMARKTVVKRLFKYLPVSIELADAVEHDNAADSDPNAAIEIDLTPTKALNAQLQHQIEGPQDNPTPPEPAASAVAGSTRSGGAQTASPVPAGGGSPVKRARTSAPKPLNDPPADGPAEQVNETAPANVGTDDQGQAATATGDYQESPQSADQEEAGGEEDQTPNLTPGGNPIANQLPVESTSTVWITDQILARLPEGMSLDDAMDQVHDRLKRFMPGGKTWEQVTSGTKSLKFSQIVRGEFWNRTDPK